MQLTTPTPRTGKIAQALAGATCALLSVNSAQAAAPGTPGTWRFDTAVLYYGEDNSRVSALEPVVLATRFFEDDKQLSAKFVLDSLTGASPTGATPSAQPQTFTRPSGNGTYVIPAQQAPLDDTFKDTRGAFTLNWAAPLNSDWRYTSGLYVSAEYDYHSLGLNGSLTRYLNDKNTELTLGLSGSFDRASPHGGIPNGLSRVPLKAQANFDERYKAERPTDNDDKNLVDLLLGVTQVLNKRTIMQFNYSLSASSGYMTDPFKMLSLIDPSSGETAQDSQGFNLYVHERRPDSRTKHALYWQTKYMLPKGDVIDASYRFMTDDWGVSSHTLDFKYRWQWEKSYLEPHMRYYSQSAADFYQRYLKNTPSTYNASTEKALMDYASADYRLGELTGTTLGVKYAKTFNHQEFSGRLEYFVQSNSGDSGFGALTKQNLYPDTKAVMFTLGYSF